MTKKLRRGYTTGTCAQAATKAAVTMLLGNVSVDQVTVSLPGKEVLTLKIAEAQKEFNKYNKSNPDIESVSCAVRKDSGDDPDITNGILVYSKVSRIKSGIVLDGGIGVGRVTKPGLDQPVGNAAINTVPRQMIAKEVSEVCHLFDFQGGIKVVISVPEGEHLAAQTFNPRLGIKGGISILGTSGIVEPMSDKALLDTIAVELKQKRAEGHSIVAISPGNYGLEFMKRTYGYDLERSVKCSNFIGDTLDMAAQEGMKELLLVGHGGKLVKLAAGVMNTHSSAADGRMEVLAAWGAALGASREQVIKILEAVTVDQGLLILEQQTGLREAVMEQVMKRAWEHLKKRAGEKLKIECIMFTNDRGILGETPGARACLERFQNSAENR